MNNRLPVSVGLGGDGDEIAAIQDVERLFGVRLNDADAPRWFTAGDVFASLKEALSEKGAEEPDIWKRFADCLAGHTGVDAALIKPESPLLSESRVWVRLADAPAYVWLAAVVIIVVVAALASL